MVSYAAIRLTKDTVISVLSSISETPAGRERLIWAMLRYQYRPEVKHYFIGGNYLRINQPDYGRQILTETELDLLFTYDKEKRKKKSGHPDPDLNWFVVKLREQHPDMIIDDEVPKAVLNEEGRYDHQRHRQEAGHVAQGNSRSGKRR